MILEGVNKDDEAATGRVSEEPAVEKLTWFPLYVDDLLSSPAWQDMEDYQRGWYIQLLLRCTRSDRLGYLKVESNLWTIAGAKRRDYFESHKAVVLACFKVREIDGHQWLYNERLLSVLREQSEKIKKRVRRASDSLSVLDVASREEVSLDTSLKCTCCGKLGAFRWGKKECPDCLGHSPHCHPKNGGKN